jgi:DNA processing protein
MMALRHWLQLSLTSGIGPILIGRIVASKGSAEAALTATVQELQTVEGIGIAKARTIHESMKRAVGDAEAQLKRAAEDGATLYCPDDEGYPPLLREIPDPPSVLFCLGKFEPRDLNAVAIVGSRRCSHYGREQAERFASLLAGAGFTVSSGGARGIDSAAHRGALRHPLGRTIAVLGSGLDVTYPPENKELFKEIAGRGVVASEFPFGTPPNAENFPRRNRVVSGMSRGVLVIEADVRSGALITARQANEEHNRPVFAVPGRVDNAMSAGPHLLIRDGAILTTSLEDIVEGLGPLPEGVSQPTLFDAALEAPAEQDAVAAEAPVNKPSGFTLNNERQELVLKQVGVEPVGVDEIIERSGLEAPLVLQELTFLTLRGLVKRVDGQSFARSGRKG